MSDEATSASFVSHDASVETEKLEEVDLLPRLQHKTLLTLDMAKWFAGPRDTIEDKMSTLANVMDGEGYTRDSGSHGQRGYEGDYRFVFLGASTPLDPRAWDAMGHTGNRFVFHELQGTSDIDEIAAQVFGESEYPEKIERCQAIVSQFLTELWDHTDGYGGISWSGEPSDEIQEHLKYLAQVVQYSRAIVSDDRSPSREGLMRILSSLRDLARGYAVLDGRQTIELEDMQICARVALSTMHRERRPVVRALLSPETDANLDASMIEKRAGVSRPTAIKRLELLDTLDLAVTDTIGSDNGKRKVACLLPEFRWPDALDFPEF